MTHERPEYILNFKKPKNTEIKYINGHWYLYERSARYDPKTKKMHKVSGKLLGTITENGYVEKKPKLDKKVFEEVDVVELGATGYLWSKNTTLIEALQKQFPDYWRELFVIAALRLVNGPRFKRLDEAYETSCLYTLLPGLDLDKSTLTSILHTVGKRRDSICKFMQSEKEELSSYLVFDGHRIISDSASLENAEMGYDSRSRFKNQVNLVYAFSIDGERCFPYYYKQFSGDVPDITAFSALVEEAGLEKRKVTMLADKGFGSDNNFEMLEDSGFSYIIPIRRTNNDSKLNLPLSYSEYEECFTYHGRAILHKEVKKEKYTIHLYLDTSLFADEMSDFTQRLEKKNNTISIYREAEEDRRKKGKNRMTQKEFDALKTVSFAEAFSEKTGMGTLALRTNDKSMNGFQVYYLYKRRQAIEDFFKTYDNSLNFSSSYMRDNYSEEAWLFLNHLSASMAFNIMDEIYLKDKTKSVSLKDFISTMSRIYADKVNNTWYCAKITKRRADFIKTFNLDLSALVRDMNAMDALL